MRTHGHGLEARRDPQRGSALAIVIILITVMAGMACMLLTVTLGGQKEQRQEREGLQVRAVARAGLSDAMYNLQRGISGAIATEAEPAAWGRASYYVTQTNLSADVISLQSTGLDDRSASRLELVVRSVPSTIWRFGAFGKEFMHMDSNARVDSYNSTLGTYESQAINGSGSTQHGNSNGDIGSNGHVRLEQNTKVWGDALAGPGHATTVLGNAVVSGSLVPMPAALELPEINVPSYPSFGSLLANLTSTIPPGNRAYGNLTVDTNRTLTIVGPANIVVTNLLLKSGSSLRIDATLGPVTLYVIDDFIMRSNSFLGPTDLQPKNLTVNLLSDNVINPEVSIELDQIDFDSNTKLYGMVYAPDAAVVINSNFELYGSLIARSVDLDSNARFHFDEALVDATGTGAATFVTICLRDLPNPTN